MSQVRVALLGGLILVVFIVGIAITAIFVGGDEAEDDEGAAEAVQTTQERTASTPTPTPFVTPSPASVAPTTTSVLPTRTPGPAPAVTPTAKPALQTASPPSEPMAVQPYWLLVVQKLSEIASSLDILGKMLSQIDSTNVLDENWRLTVASHLAIIRLAHQSLAAVTPPAELAGFHQTLLEATGDCDSATQFLASGLGSGGMEHLGQGLVLIASCGEKFEVIAQMAVELASESKPPDTTPEPSATVSEPATASKPPDITPEPSATVSEPATATPSPQPSDTPTPRPPTTTPAQTLTPQLQGPTVLANNGNVNVRSGPGSDFEVVSRLPDGQSLPIVGRNEDSSWWQVELPTGILAWVAADVTAASNVENVPVVAVPEPLEN